VTTKKRPTTGDRRPTTNDRRVLWAPWRMQYIGSAKEPGCIFCDKRTAPDQKAALVLARTPHTIVILNRFPYANGHIMVAPRRHTAELSALPADEHLELAEVLRRSMTLLQEFFHPEGMNVGMNLGRAAGAGITEHLHWHVVPRWVGDTNFMPLIGEVRCIPEHLEALWDRLRPVFAQLES
jgi:ATP adenylyltransferase